MKPAVAIAAGAMLGLAGLMLAARSRSAAAAAPDDGGDQTPAAPDLITWASDTAADLIQRVSSMSKWTPDLIPEQYRATIIDAEDHNGMPRNMLGRLLWQESRYRPDIISGKVRSPAGALGIAQFMPATAAEFGVDPLDPTAAIDAAGRYLAQLYRQFGTWEQALAAYNWGPGNLRRRGLAAAPAETRAYYSQILADLGNGGVYA